MSGAGRKTVARASLGPWAQEQRREHPAWFSVGECHLDSGSCDLTRGVSSGWCWVVNHMFVLRLYLVPALLSLPGLNNFLRTASSLRSRPGF